MVALTIGMPTYNDFDGVYFTLQALRLYQDLDDTELLVVDNYGCEHTKDFVDGWAKARYVLATDAVGTAAAKNRVFAEAKGDAVLCCDSHVLLVPGSIARLKDYYRAHPASIDLLQGPLVYDDLKTISTHLDPVWRGQMWGIWGTDPRGLDPEAEPFEIWAQGMGVFSSRKEAWPGFHPAFRGFGGEEGYIQEKVRQHGGRCLCLPWLRWGHRFGRPAGIPYRISTEDKFRNYFIGYVELGLDLAPLLEHFDEHLPDEAIIAVTDQVLGKQKVQKLKKGKRDKKHTKNGKYEREENRALPDSPAFPVVNIISKAKLLADPSAALPLVSCICSTYNRPPTHTHLVEEAIESFLRQTYPNKELIVLNDCPGQELLFNAPGVRVINVPERFPGLGEKHNAAIDAAQGELIAIWDDDDISLPWRLSLSVDRLGDADYFNPKRFWMMARDQLLPDPKTNVGHNLSLFRRSAYEHVGRYPPMGSGLDAAIDQSLRRAVQCVGSEHVREGALTYHELYYIYRWGVSPMHLSAAGSKPEEKYDNVGARSVEPGHFQLRPAWRQDYVSETRRIIALMTRSSGLSLVDAPILEAV